MFSMSLGIHDKLRVHPEIADTHSRINISYLKEYRACQKSHGLSPKYSASATEVYWLDGSRISLNPGESLVVNHDREVQFDFPEGKSPALGMCIYFHPKDVAEVLANSQGL